VDDGWGERGADGVGTPGAAIPSTAPGKKLSSPPPPARSTWPHIIGGVVYSYVKLTNFHGPLQPA
jgi:hypothetical protein